MTKHIAWLIDTSVFLNILAIPSRSQNRELILNDMSNKVKNNDIFYLPYPTIIETGNFIAQIDGNHKYIYAKDFVEIINKAFDQQVPWKIDKIVTIDELKQYLDSFPDYASKQIGFADFSIIKEQERLQQLLGKNYVVNIWSIDKHLNA